MAPQDLPCANAALLALLQTSADFAAIVPRLPIAFPLDTWQEDGLHFVVFRLRPDGDASNEHGAESEALVAVFVMSFGSDVPISALVVTPGPDGAHPEVHDVRTLDEASSMGS